MIHSGAIVANQFSKLSAGPLTCPFRTSSEARDFTAAGAAAGVAAAFGAPIGGVLFAIEEGATHMNPIIMVRTFVCASFAALTVRFFTGPLEHRLPWGSLGNEVPTEFGRFPGARRYFLSELFVFAAMGVVGGLLGAAANAANTRLTQWRMKHIGPRGHFRYAEAFAVTFVIVSFNFFAPLLQGGPAEFQNFTPEQRLFVEAGNSGIKDLLHNEADMNPFVLFFFAMVHYFQLIWTYGLGVPSGLFVPALLGGASFGRLFGQAVQASAGIAASPGIYALVGATAMLGGMARITISLSVILMETTGEAEWGLPIFITTLAAKWTGDLFNKGIYDIHIELKHVPLLEIKPEKRMLSMQASDIMTRDIVAVEAVVTVDVLLHTLGGCEHHGFPVVDQETGQFIGLVERNTLHHVLHLGSQAGIFMHASPAGPPAMVQYEDMLRNFHPTLFPSLEVVRSGLTSSDFQKVVDLRPYTNQSCYTIPEHTSATRCYQLFREMGLRHLPVLGSNGKVAGIITRRNLIAAQEGHVEPKASLPGLPVPQNSRSSILKAEGAPRAASPNRGVELQAPLSPSVGDGGRGRE